jgi:hypothetical protein
MNSPCQLPSILVHLHWKMLYRFLKSQTNILKPQLVVTLKEQIICLKTLFLKINY